MANSALRQTGALSFGSSDSSHPLPETRIRRLVWKIALATLVLMAIGSATRVMDAGLACPDWPLCYGTLFPGQQMNLQVFLEWFHRLDASLIGLMTLMLAGLSWWHRQDLPTWFPGIAIAAVGLILFQGLLGGLTVTELLRFDIVTAHLGTALLFFTVLLVMGAMLLPYQATGTAGKLRWLGLGAALLIYLQSLSGALVGSRWAVHQCLAGSSLCGVLYTHLTGVVPAAIATLLVVILSWRTPALHSRLRRLANAAALFLVLQIGLGIATLKFRLQVEPLTVAHQMIGACLLAVLVCLTVLSWRDRAPLTQVAPSDPVAPDLGSSTSSALTS
jgi:cytochrome c oxidase assembly protein subunit 15